MVFPRKLWDGFSDSLSRGLRERKKETFWLPVKILIDIPQKTWNHDQLKSNSWGVLKICSPASKTGCVPPPQRQTHCEWFLLMPGILWINTCLFSFHFKSVFWVASRVPTNEIPTRIQINIRDVRPIPQDEGTTIQLNYDKRHIHF